MASVGVDHGKKNSHKRKSCDGNYGETEDDSTSSSGNFGTSTSDGSTSPDISSPPPSPGKLKSPHSDRNLGSTETAETAEKTELMMNAGLLSSLSSVGGSLSYRSMSGMSGLSEDPNCDKNDFSSTDGGTCLAPGQPSFFAPLVFVLATAPPRALCFCGSPASFHFMHWHHNNSRPPGFTRQRRSSFQPLSPQK